MKQERSAAPVFSRSEYLCFYHFRKKPIIFVFVPFLAVKNGSFHLRIFMIPKNPLNKVFFYRQKKPSLINLKNRGTKTKKNGHFLI